MESKLFGCEELNPGELQQVNGGALDDPLNQGILKNVLSLLKGNLSASTYVILKKDLGSILLFSKYGI